MAHTNLTQRQRMINMMYLVLTAMLALNVTAEVLNAFKTVDDGIGRSNHSLEIKTAGLFTDFDNQMQLDAKKTEPYKLKAVQSQKISKALYDHIEQYKQQIIKEAGGYDPKSGQLVSNDNIDIATRIFVEESNGKKLKEEIQKTKEQLLALSSDEDRNLLTASIPLMIEEPKDKLSWEFHKFNQVPTVAAVTLLSKYQNDVLASENQLVEYFYKKIDATTFKMDHLTALVSSPSNYIMQGLSYKANIMLTAYSSTQNPDVFIGGFTGQVRKNAAGNYDEIISPSENPPLTNPKKVDVSNGLGKIQMQGNSVGESKYTGVIRVKDPGGNGYKFYPFEGEYQVAAKSAVVSPTSMNVLYAGLDNPVSVSVPGVSQKDVTASFDGPGLLEKKPDGSYTVKPTNRGKYKVHVSAKVDGNNMQMGEMEFRVKRIPDPVSTIDGRLTGGTISEAVLKSTGGVVARLDDFVFPVGYTVLGYDISTRDLDNSIIRVHVDGAAYNANAKKLLSRKFKKGDAVFIDDIYAKGPDGEKRKLSPLAFMIN
jgi:gliding motility-associated protein GldM